jgi:hypothetical protein
MDIDLADLPDNVETLQRMVRTLATERANLTAAKWLKRHGTRRIAIFSLISLATTNKNGLQMCKPLEDYRRAS